ncbi:MAG: GFA family protein [Vibrio sp.]
MKYPIKGECQCGQVSYLLHQAPNKVLACHCTDCQKLSSSPFSVTAIVDAKQIEFSGELASWERVAQSGNRNRGAFCPNCGVRIYQINPDAPNLIKLKLKPIDADQGDVFKPQAHVWVSEKLDWYQLPSDVKAFDKGMK